LHAFDAAKNKWENNYKNTTIYKFTTLDDIERTLHEEDPNVCDEKDLCVSQESLGKTLQYQNIPLPYSWKRLL
jgi:phenylalanyl-tRNA synthetase beta chain